MKDQIISDYKTREKTFEAFRERIVNLIKDLLSEQNIVPHQINSRIKTPDSLSKKIDIKGEKYSTIYDITDIIGIRIIAYMESDVDEIAELIEKEFSKDKANSIDKRKLKTDQFGYRSLHLVASLSENRCDLKEYKSYKGLKFEIQIRSILQNAWAEIEHDLGYKGQSSIPDKYKRAFNRLSALLETADIEFDRLKIDLENYEKQIPELIKSKSDEVDINSASIEYFIRTNDIILEATRIIRKNVDSDLHDTNDYEHPIKSLNHFGLFFLKDLTQALEKDKVQYLNFVKVYVIGAYNRKDPPYKTAPLLYYTHFLAARNQNLDATREYFKIYFGDDIWRLTKTIALDHINDYIKSIEMP